MSNTEEITHFSLLHLYRLSDFSVLSFGCRYLAALLHVCVSCGGLGLDGVPVCAQFRRFLNLLQLKIVRCNDGVRLRGIT